MEAVAPSFAARDAAKDPAKQIVAKAAHFESMVASGAACLTWFGAMHGLRLVRRASIIGLGTG